MVEKSKKHTWSLISRLLFWFSCRSCVSAGDIWATCKQESAATDFIREISSISLFQLAICWWQKGLSVFQTWHIFPAKALSYKSFRKSLLASAAKDNPFKCICKHRLHNFVCTLSLQSFTFLSVMWENTTLSLSPSVALFHANVLHYVVGSTLQPRYHITKHNVVIKHIFGIYCAAVSSYLSAIISADIKRYVCNKLISADILAWLICQSSSNRSNMTY